MNKPKPKERVFVTKAFRVGMKGGWRGQGEGEDVSRNGKRME